MCECNFSVYICAVSNLILSFFNILLFTVHDLIDGGHWGDLYELIESITFRKLSVDIQIIFFCETFKKKNECSFH